MIAVIPMAGRGSRFVDAGYATPKPLIEVRGRPMYTWALAGLPLDQCTGIVFLCLEEHLQSGALEDDLRRRYRSYDLVIIPVAQVTEGQACTVLLAKQYINNSEGLIIHNADTWFQSKLGERLKHRPPEVDGFITVFEAAGVRWSFAAVEPSGVVSRVAEKECISRWATVGMYHFTRGSDFVSAAEHMIAAKLAVGQEYYVGPVYNLLIEQGSRILPDYADEVGCMGTPEDLTEFLSSR